MRRCPDTTTLGAVRLCVFALALALPLAPLHAQEGSKPSPSQPARLAPNDPAWQRYEVNQTFQGGVYFKDNNIWTYDKDFADLFGMPAKHIEAIEGAAAAAYRIEEASFQDCGWGGQPDVCRRVEYCYLDLYFDEAKTPLPWATEHTRYAWVPNYGSVRWLKPQHRNEKPRTLNAAETPPGIVRALVGSPLIAFADPQTKLEAFFTTNQYIDKGPGDSGAPAILGYSREFYRSLSVVSLQMGCTPFGRKSIDLKLNAKKQIFGDPVARFNQVRLPEGFVQRIKDAINARRQRNSEFYRGLLDARVKLVSADAADPKQTPQGQPPTLTYRAMLELGSRHLVSAATGEKLGLSPGMLVSAEIHQGRRTVLEYLLSPVSKTLQEAARER